VHWSCVSLAVLLVKPSQPGIVQVMFKVRCLNIYRKYGDLLDSMYQMYKKNVMLGMSITSFMLIGTTAIVQNTFHKKIKHLGKRYAMS